MFLKNGDYLKVSDILYMSTVQTISGKRQWDVTLTKELVAPDSFMIELKLCDHQITLNYDNKDDALEDYNNIFIRLPKD